MTQGKNQNKLDKIVLQYNGLITGLQDLTANEEPSKLFYFLARYMRYLLDTEPDIAISEKGIKRREKIYFLLKKYGGNLLGNPQVFENRKFLRNPTLTDVLPDEDIVLPPELVIWAANHVFKDDILATVLALRRHAYIFIGSLPQLYNTIDGIAAWLVGVVMMNRKVEASRRASVPKAVKVMQLGADLVVFPEGVWNKSPNKLILDLWPGIYRIACETGAKVVPIVHYIRDCNNAEKNNPIHTVVDDPIRIDDLSEKAALNYLRDILGEWFYLMMEIYGRTTRDKLLKEAKSPNEVWEIELRNRLKPVNRYDKEIELCADYRPKDKVLPQDVWRTVAEIENITKDNILHVLYAKQLVERLDTEDFQRRF